MLDREVRSNGQVRQRCLADECEVGAVSTPQFAEFAHEAFERSAQLIFRLPSDVKGQSFFRTDWPYFATAALRSSGTPMEARRRCRAAIRTPRLDLGRSGPDIRPSEPLPSPPPWPLSRPKKITASCPQRAPKNRQRRLPAASLGHVRREPQVDPECRNRRPEGV